MLVTGLIRPFNPQTSPAQPSVALDVQFACYIFPVSDPPQRHGGFHGFYLSATLHRHPLHVAETLHVNKNNASTHSFISYTAPSIPAVSRWEQVNLDRLLTSGSMEVLWCHLSLGAAAARGNPIPAVCSSEKSTTFSSNRFTNHEEKNQCLEYLCWAL